MNALEGIIEDLNTTNFDLIQKEFTLFQNGFKKINRIFGRVYDAIAIYKETGVDPEIDFEADIDAESNESAKENIEPANFRDDVLSTTFTRPIPIPDVTQSTKKFNDTIVKGEATMKLEEQPSEVLENGKIKFETEKMPAPARPAPKKKSRKTKTQKKIKQEKPEVARDSDVVIQDVRMSLINLVDSDLENEEQHIEKSRKKRTCQLSRTDVQVKSEKRSKSDEHVNLSSHSVYEVATSAGDENVINATFVSKAATSLKPPLSINTTVVVENPKYVQAKSVVDDLMTDDDSVELGEEKRTINTPHTVTKSATIGSNQLFSPFEQSPVKRKVQAFEKLVKANAIPVRVTRNTARQQEGAVKEYTKIFTMTPVKFIPKAISTTVKVNKTASANFSSDIILPAKSASALKASQVEYREREQKRREKEEQALRKREALMQAHIEDKKRKREEKQLKAQQQREALEKEKQKALEIQRLKDERHKQLLVEQEERKQKQKDEIEKKRVMAKAKALELKKVEEARKLEEQRKAKEANRKKQNQESGRMQEKLNDDKVTVPLYMKNRAPLLPTQDCYDSDDEKHAKQGVQQATWARDIHINNMQLQTIKMRAPIKNSFFCRQGQTPDLQEIFEVIEPKKLKRSSSAVWYKPPRFTMMPMVEEHEESNDFSDDDFAD